MSAKVKHYLVIDSVGVAINTFVCLMLCHLCGMINQSIIEVILKIIVIGLGTIINLSILFFFLLYWWSDIKWTECKRKARNFKKKFTL